MRIGRPRPRDAARVGLHRRQAPQEQHGLVGEQRPREAWTQRHLLRAAMTAFKKPKNGFPGSSSISCRAPVCSTMVSRFHASLARTITVRQQTCNGVTTTPKGRTCARESRTSLPAAHMRLACSIDRFGRTRLHRHHSADSVWRIFPLRGARCAVSRGLAVTRVAAAQRRETVMSRARPTAPSAPTARSTSRNLTPGRAAK